MVDLHKWKSNLKVLKQSKLVKNMNYFMIIMLLFVIIYISNTRHINKYNLKVNITKNIVESRTPNDSSQRLLKYILLWTSDKATPFVYLGNGQSVFVNKKCQWTNCFVTSDRNYLGYYTEFDVIAFNGPQLSSLVSIRDLPTKRSYHQKYVYANIEAAANYPVERQFWSGFFNWTWTYKLDSDCLWGYFAIRNSTKDIIGPKIAMQWMSIYDMDPIDNEFKEKLKSKNKAAAWFSSNCYTLNLREEYVSRIQKELKMYNLQIDIYGSCGTFQCPRNLMDRCLKRVEKHYYFFFAFENAFSEDYVTEKVVYALNHNTVPVVFGGAKYSRFLPSGSYLNAVELGPKKLASEINNIIRNPDRYHDFFRWKKYYSYHFRNESPDTDDYCRFCAMVNDESLTKITKVYEQFHMWWTSNVSAFYFNYTRNLE